MAKKPGRKKSPDQLRTEIARSREEVAQDLRGLRTELDFPRKIRKSFRRQTGVWIAAAAVVGVLIAIRSTRKRKVYVDAKPGGKHKNHRLLEAGFALGALRVAATLLKPVVVKFVTQKIRDYAGGAHSAKKW